MKTSNSNKISLTILLAVLVSILNINAFAQTTQKTQTTQAKQTQPSFDVKVEGKGAPMILIPGLSCSGDVWDETIQKYKDLYECHVFTLAGFDTVAPLKSPSLETIKNDLKTYIDKHNLQKATLIGHSLGGFMSLWLSSENPDYFSKIIIVDALPYLAALYNPVATPETVPFDPEMMYQMVANLPDSVYAIQQTITLNTMITDSLDVAKALKWAVNSDRKSVIYAAGTMMKTDLREQVKSIKIPVLVLGAWDGPAIQAFYPDFTKERITQLYSDQYKNVENLKLEFPKQARHFLMYDDPNWFFSQIDDFLKTQ